MLLTVNGPSNLEQKYKVRGNLSAGEHITIFIPDPRGDKMPAELKVYVNCSLQQTIELPMSMFDMLQHHTEVQVVRYKTLFSKFLYIFYVLLFNPGTVSIRL